MQQYQRLFSKVRVREIYSGATLGICFAVMSLVCAGLASAAPREVIPGEYLIEPAALGAGSLTTSAVSALSSAGLRIKDSISGGKRLLVSPRVSALSASSLYDEADTFCKELIRSGVARSCEQNQKISINNTTPNDPRLSDLWGMSTASGIDAPRAWDYSQGSTEVVVSVIDTGIDYSHPDLIANVWTNPGEIAGNGIDDDANGYIDDIHGMNALTNSGNPMDDNSHGTHVSGTIGGRGNNGVGVVGVNWNVKIMGLKFLGSGGSGSVAGAVKAIDYMVLMKQRGVNIRVSNNSWGGPGFSQALSDAIQRASAAGIVFVAAAGNEGNDNDSAASYPAGYESPNVVSVAAIDRQQNLASFSNYGLTTVDIAAPGVDILSTVPGGYASYSGTSMATPHVSGALALLFSIEPSLSVSSALQRLYDTGVALTTLNGAVRTGRTLNAGRLMANDAVPVPPPAPAPEHCPFGLNARASGIDRRADDGFIVINEADEFNFNPISLPFSFSFDGVAVSKVVPSPNGVLYFGSAPSSMDWQNGGAAPNNSLAALHSDFVSTVRVSLSSDSATIYWKSSLYTNPDGGYAETRVTLSSDGSIKESVLFSSPAIEQAVRSQVTIGVTGRAGQSVTTYSHNDKKIKNGTVLLYTPTCGAPNPPPTGGDPLVSQVRMWGLDAAGRLLSTLTPGERLRIKVRSLPESGAVMVQGTVRLDGELCSDAPEVTLNPGADVTLQGRLSRSMGSYGVKQLSIAFGDSQAKRQVIQSRSLKTRGKAKRVLTKARFSALCASITRTLRVKEQAMNL